MWGAPPTLHFAFYNLRLRIGVHQCSSVVTPLGFFCLPPLLPLPSLQAMATNCPCATVAAGWRRRAGSWRGRPHSGGPPAGGGGSNAPFSLGFKAFGGGVLAARAQTFKPLPR